MGVTLTLGRWGSSGPACASRMCLRLRNGLDLHSVEVFVPLTHVALP